ncbi:MAG: hypothetical protein CM1200mP30_11530 [Pseudomonadota bacterium]|nr:MAG: hypothetical protein CM1200mP30_11530 [Pseudomonadota bacterium]
MVMLFSALLTWPFFLRSICTLKMQASCPDWPLCYGQCSSSGYEIFLETSHRFVAALLGY